MSEGATDPQTTQEELTSTEYEQLVQAIYQAFLQQGEFKNITVEHVGNVNNRVA